MSWDMIMKLPIQDRRALINKHNREQEKLERIREGQPDLTNRKYEGESINKFAKLEQNNLKNGLM